jgi:hypothetical protein
MFHPKKLKIKLRERDITSVTLMWRIPKSTRRSRKRALRHARLKGCISTNQDTPIVLHDGWTINLRKRN